MCRELEVSKAGYYKWLHRTESDAERENEQLATLIKEYDERFNHILGYRRMTDWINHFPCPRRLRRRSTCKSRWWD